MCILYIISITRYRTYNVCKRLYTLVIDCYNFLNLCFVANPTPDSTFTFPKCLYFHYVPCHDFIL